MTLADAFEGIVRLSYYGTIASFGVCLISFLTDYVRAPKWIVLCLWGLVGIRLLCPVEIISQYSIFQIDKLSEAIEADLDFEGTYAGDFKAAAEGTDAYDEAIAVGSPVEMTEYGIQVAYFYEKEDGTIAPAQTAHEASSTKYAIVWMCGIGIFWLWAVISYIRLRYRLQFAVRVADGIYESDMIASPCAVGFIKPRIYLTMDLTESQRNHILLHEQMHIKYGDIWWKVLSFVVMSMHWFNPYLWLMYRAFQGDIEKACDERVLRVLGEERKQDYSESLLALARERKWSLPTPISFGEDDTKDRIKAILRYKKPVFAVTAGVVILGVLAGVVFMTGSSLENKNIVLPTGDEIENDITGIATEEIETESVGALDSVDMDRVFEELNVNGVIYQAKRDGIHRIANQADEIIYDKYPGTTPGMMVYEDNLYFLTDSYYQEGALEWDNTVVRRIDLKSGAIEDLELSFSGNGTPIIHNYRFFNGVMLVEYQAVSDEHIDVFFLDRDELPSGEKITMLSEEDAQYLGERMTQTVLNNKGVLTDITGYVQDESTVYLDMDGDGTSERIFLKIYAQGFGYMAREYRLQIGDAFVENFGEELESRLWALSLDGKQILLAIYQDGPSADPYTTFFCYRNGKVEIAGSFEADVRECVLHDGVITGSLRQEIVQTDWIRVSWKQNAEGMIEMIPQETYDFLSLNEVDLLETIPLHKEIGSEEVFEVAPQKVIFSQVSGDWEWLYITTADGQNGWVHVVDFKVVELQKNVLDVFDGVYLAG